MLYTPLLFRPGFLKPVPHYTISTSVPGSKEVVDLPTADPVYDARESDEESYVPDRDPAAPVVAPTAPEPPIAYTETKAVASAALTTYQPWLFLIM